MEGEGVWYSGFGGIHVGIAGGNGDVGDERPASGRRGRGQRRSAGQDRAEKKTEEINFLLR